MFRCCVSCVVARALFYTTYHTSNRDLARAFSVWRTAYVPACLCGVCSRTEMACREAASETREGTECGAASSQLTHALHIHRLVGVFFLPRWNKSIFLVGLSPIVERIRYYNNISHIVYTRTDIPVRTYLVHTWSAAIRTIKTIHHNR